MRPRNVPPSIETLLEAGEAQPLIARRGRERVAQALRRAAERYRTGELSSVDALLREALRSLEKPAGPARVVNATGVLLHTNLGRAPLAARARDAVAAASGYCTLEYDAERGERGKRGEHVRPLVLDLFAPARQGVDALVVTNNAAALLLALDTVANGRPVAVSRGELVAIGGDFRVPSILAKSGASLREVGTTNRTTLRDYEEALEDGAAALLKVKPSNYRIVGYTEEVSLDALAALARKRSVPLLFDAGAGTPRRLAEPAMADEPVPSEALDAGADLVCFSADKTLGGPQAGILLGGRELVGRAASNPLARALRPDKLALAALAATLELLLEGRDGEVPFVRMLTTPLPELERRASRIAEEARTLGYRGDAVASTAVPGGGAGSEGEIPSYAVRLAREGLSADDLAAALRSRALPVVARVAGEAVLLDMRTVDPAEDAFVLGALTGIARDRAP